MEKYEDIAIEFIELPEEAGAYAKLIAHAIRQRLQARELEDQAKKLKEAANSLFLSMAKAAGFTSVVTTKGSMYVQRSDGRLTFKKEKAKDALLKAGVDSDLVVEAFIRATSKSAPTETVAFRLPEEKGEVE